MGIIGRYLLSLIVVATTFIGWEACGDELLSWNTCVRAECLAVTPDGYSVCVGEKGPYISIWDIESGALRARLLATRDSTRAEAGLENDKPPIEGEEKYGEYTRAIAVSPDGELMAAVVSTTRTDAHGEEYLSLWHLGDEKQLAFARLPDFQEVMDALRQGQVRGLGGGGAAFVRGPVPSVAFAPEGKHIAVSGWDGSRVWDIEANEFRPRIRVDARFASTTSGDLLATAYERQGVMLHDASQTLVDRLDTREWGLGQMVFSHDGQTLAIPARKKIVLWRLNRPPRVRKLNRLPGRHEVVSLAFDAGDTHFVSGHRYGAVAVWSLKSWRPLLSFQTKERGDAQVAFGGKGGDILITATGKTIQTWNFAKLLADNGH